MFTKQQFIDELKLRLESVEITIANSKADFDKHNKIYQAYLTQKENNLKSGKRFKLLIYPESDYINSKCSERRIDHFTQLKQNLIQINKDILTTDDLSSIKLPSQISEIPNKKFVRGKVSPLSYEYDPHRIPPPQSAKIVKIKATTTYTIRLIEHHPDSTLKTITIFGAFNRKDQADTVLKKIEMVKDDGYTKLRCEHRTYTVDSTKEMPKRYNWDEIKAGRRGLKGKVVSVPKFDYKDAYIA